MRAVCTTPNARAIGRIFLQERPLRVTLEHVETAKQSAQREAARSRDSSIDKNIVKQAFYTGIRDSYGLKV